MLDIFTPYSITKEEIILVVQIKLLQQKFENEKKKKTDSSNFISSRLKKVESHSPNAREVFDSLSERDFLLSLIIEGFAIRALLNLILKTILKIRILMLMVQI